MKTWGKIEKKNRHLPGGGEALRVENIVGVLEQERRRFVWWTTGYLGENPDAEKEFIFVNSATESPLQRVLTNTPIKIG